MSDFTFHKLYRYMKSFPVVTILGKYSFIHLVIKIYNRSQLNAFQSFFVQNAGTVSPVLDLSCCLGLLDLKMHKRRMSSCQVI